MCVVQNNGLITKWMTDFLLFFFFLKNKYNNIFMTILLLIDIYYNTIYIIRGVPTRMVRYIGATFNRVTYKY